MRRYPSQSADQSGCYAAFTSLIHRDSTDGSTYIANGEIDTEFVPVESEHSAMSAAIDQKLPAQEL